MGEGMERKILFAGNKKDKGVNLINDYSKGKSIKEIRDEIDKKYENGYATPTPTPEV